MWIFWIIFEGDQWRGRSDGLIDDIWIFDIPNIGIHAHIVRHFLELKNGIGDSNLMIIIRIP